jgi:hypothetical protein
MVSGLFVSVGKITALFPLTPTLSPGERETAWVALGEAGLIGSRETLITCRSRNEKEAGFDFGEA